MRYLIEIGGCSLDVTVADPDSTDFDGTFTAVCNDTGETLRINGWLMDDIEQI